jgi:hypothetical protein
MPRTISSECDGKLALGQHRSPGAIEDDLPVLRHYESGLQIPRNRSLMGGPTHYENDVIVTVLLGRRKSVR